MASLEKTYSKLRRQSLYISFKVIEDINFSAEEWGHLFRRMKYYVLSYVIGEDIHPLEISSVDFFDRHLSAGEYVEIYYNFITTERGTLLITPGHTERIPKKGIIEGFDSEAITKSILIDGKIGSIIDPSSIEIRLF